MQSQSGIHKFTPKIIDIEQLADWILNNQSLLKSKATKPKKINSIGKMK